MKHPPGFQDEARARVETDKIKAGTDAWSAQQTRLMSDRDFSGAMKSIFDRARDGQEAEHSRDALCMYAFLAVKRTRSGQTPKENWEGCWAQDTGKTWKALTEFPSRVRKMSAEMRGISRSSFFDPEQAIRGRIHPGFDFLSQIFSADHEGDEFVELSKQLFSALPQILDRYANWLEVQTGGISAYMRRFYRRAPRKHSGFIHAVTNEVKRITGRVCDRQVVDLLNAADRLVNPQHQGNGDRFDEPTIALLRSRRKRRASKT